MGPERGSTQFSETLVDVRNLKTLSGHWVSRCQNELGVDSPSRRRRVRGSCLDLGYRQPGNRHQNRPACRSTAWLFSFVSAVGSVLLYGLYAMGFAMHFSPRPVYLVGVTVGGLLPGVGAAISGYFPGNRDDRAG